MALISCGRESANSDAFTRDYRIPEPETLQRLYRADIRAVNPYITPDIEGQATVRLVEDIFDVNIVVRNVPSVIHPQRILKGEKCPDSGADTNNDGIISFAEAEAVSGVNFIPLDNNLSELTENAGGFPDGGLLRGYVYRERTSRSKLLADLGDEFDLEDRVIMIYGSDSDETLPIGCAELFQVIGQP